MCNAGSDVMCNAESDNPKALSWKLQLEGVDDYIAYQHLDDSKYDSVAPG